MEFVILWILCGVVAAMIGAKKGVARAEFYAGLFLGPIGILIAIFSKGDRKSCSYCKEWIHKDATVCPHCQRERWSRCSRFVVPSVESEDRYVRPF
jgi:hypothetical protein